MKVLATSLLKLKRQKKKITALTAYDFPFAKLVDESGIDIVLVGDSVGMVSLGYETTLPVTMEDMLHHLKAVRRAVKNSLLVVDMPFNSYANPALALQNAKRFVHEGAEAVKLEGGLTILSQIKLLIKNQIAVLGHLGMTPQSIKELGGYKVQGRTEEQAERIYEEALLLERSGVFGIVLECIPYQLAKKISAKLKIPTIGIGAGPYTDGQVLVLHDLLGIESAVRPRFVRTYADLTQEVRVAIRRYRTDVLQKKFPNIKESFA